MSFKPVPMQVSTESREEVINKMVENNKIQAQLTKTLSGGAKVTVPCPTTIGGVHGSNQACQASIDANSALLEAKVGAMYDASGGSKKRRCKKKNRKKSGKRNNCVKKLRKKPKTLRKHYRKKY